MLVVQVGHVMMVVFQADVQMQMGMGLIEVYTFNMIMNVMAVIVPMRVCVSNFVMGMVMYMFFVDQ